MAEDRNRSGSALETSVAHSSTPADADHDEWLIDESIEETFPASDPTLPIRPGSTLALRHQVRDE